MLPLSTSAQTNLFNENQEPKVQKPETVKIEVSADDADWSTQFILERSKYPKKKSHYIPFQTTGRYSAVRVLLREAKKLRPEGDGWKYRVIRKTYAKIEVTQLVKVEVLK